MKSLLRNIILSSIGNLKPIANGVHILNSHYIGRKNLSPTVFRELLYKLSKHAEFIKIENAILLIKEGKPINKKLIAFTFDDGFEECYTKIAPILKEFNTNAAFFINPGFIDGDTLYKNNFLTNIVHTPNKDPMSWDMIRKLHHDGFIIGNHTLDHKKLLGLTDLEIQKQIIDSKKIIEEQINAPCNYFAWTYGRLTDINELALNTALKTHKFVFSGDNYKKYYSFNNRVFNRRHIEGDWPIAHVKYFLSYTKEH